MPLHLNGKEIDKLAKFLLSEPIRTELLEVLESMLDDNEKQELEKTVQNNQKKRMKQMAKIIIFSGAGIKEF